MDSAVQKPELKKRVRPDTSGDEGETPPTKKALRSRLKAENDESGEKQIFASSVSKQNEAAEEE